ncbi:pimeloyl-ACP methyl ester carboxylesterase [Actinomycetospora cinnamomea]|uniref:Pimeloyl-ACP methyl ester carboxylesterase n=2 Tax=Actinomycetospora cinnamomea TaxID=663609 RepID=A0A2U1FRW6_9PSEU|nr:pimeloyl-ACP methyl ester carboxylesterase [Actinomycetospora cinnamomea]
MGIGGFVDEAARTRHRSALDAAMAVLPPHASHDVPTVFGIVRVHRFGGHHSDGGPGRPVLLLPGRLGTTAMWAPNLPALVARRPVWALDPLGEPGASEQTAPITGDADQAAWLAEVVGALGGPLHVVGASLGARWGLELAVRHPAGVASLALLEPAHTLSRLRPGFVATSLLAAVPGLHGLVLRHAGGGSPPADDPLTPVLVLGGTAYRLRLAPPGYPSDAALRSLGMPVLALLGGRSTVGHAARGARRARALIADVEVEVWPEATHALPSSHAERVDERLAAFHARADR